MSIIKLAFAGDTMTGDQFYTMGSGVRTNINKYGEDFIDKGIIDIFKNHDLVFCNLECIISDKGVRTASLRSMDMRGTPDTADKLARWGINIVNLANNHILEHGKEAALDTIDKLKKAGIEVIGCGSDKSFNNEIGVVKKTISGINFYFISLCFINDKYAYNGGNGVDELFDKISEIKLLNNSMIIVSLHWGHEYIDRPSIDQKILADRLFNAGVNLIIGHHPHVYQGSRCDNNQLIAYSLGNFVFGDFYKDTKWSAILSVTLKDMKIISYELLPVFSDKEHKPVLASGEIKNELLTEIKRRNDLLDSDIYKKNEDKTFELEVNNKTQQFRKEMRNEIFKNIISGKVRLKYIPGIFLRPVQRRMNLW